MPSEPEEPARTFHFSQAAAAKPWEEEEDLARTRMIPPQGGEDRVARQTAQKLKDTHLDRVIVSPLLRARQTAELICQGRALPLSVDARVREQNYGIYEGVSRFDQGFLSHKRSFATRYPGGESHMSTAVRVYSFLEDTARNCPGESVLVVCHGGICRIIESYFHDMTNEEFFQFNMGNCEVREYQLELPQGEGGETW